MPVTLALERLRQVDGESEANQQERERETERQIHRQTDTHKAGGGAAQKRNRELQS